LKAVSSRVKRRPLERLLKANDILRKGPEQGKILHRILKRHIKSLQKAKKKSYDRGVRQAQMCNHQKERGRTRRNWPHIPLPELKRQLVQMFRDETSREINSSDPTSAFCEESVLLAQRKIENWHNLDLDVLRRPHKERDEDMSSDYFQTVAGFAAPTRPFALLHMTW
jgi:hypothetical protein